MNCSGSCNQGRNCTCGPVMKMDRMLALIIVMAVVSVIAAAAIVLDSTMPGAGKWAATALAGLFAAGGLCYAIYWLAEKVIDAIAFLTRWED